MSLVAALDEVNQREEWHLHEHQATQANRCRGNEQAFIGHDQQVEIIVPEQSTKLPKKQLRRHGIDACSGPRSGTNITYSKMAEHMCC